MSRSTCDICGQEVLPDQPQAGTSVVDLDSVTGRAYSTPPVHIHLACLYPNGPPGSPLPPDAGE